MSFHISSIDDVITSEMFDTQMATIKGQKHHKEPSTSLPHPPPANTSAQLIEGRQRSLTLTYDNSDWLVYARMSRSYVEVRSELVVVRHAVANALSSTKFPADEALKLVMQSLAEFPAFGDLYIALAGLKFKAFQIDAALKLIELAELCPHHHERALATMKQKLTICRPSWDEFITKYFRRFIHPSSQDDLNRMIPPEVAQAAKPFLEQVQIDSAYFLAWQTSPDVRNWFDMAGTALLPACSFPIVEVPHAYPLASLAPSITTHILSYLDMSSVLRLRSTCGELFSVIGLSNYWAGVIGARLGMPLDDLPAAFQAASMELFRELRFIVKMINALMDESSYRSFDMEAFSAVFAPHADSLILGNETAVPGKSWVDSTFLNFSCRFAIILQFDRSGRLIEYLEDQCPGFFRFVFELLTMADIVTLAAAFDLLHCVITSESPRRKNWIYLLRHWRMSVHVKKNCLSRAETPRAPIYSLCAALDGADLIDCTHFTRHFRPTMSDPDELELLFGKERYDGIWWISRNDAQRAGLDGIADLICCNLIRGAETSNEVGEHLATFSGSTVDSRGIKGAIKGTINLSSGMQEFQFTSGRNLTYTGILHHYGIGGYAHAPGEDKTPSHGFFMWRDSRAATSQFWKEASTVLVKAAEPVSLAHYCDNTTTPGMLLPTYFSAGMVQVAAKFSKSSVPQLLLVANHNTSNIMTLAEQSRIPRGVLDPVSQGAEESDDAFSIRQDVFYGSETLLNSTRVILACSFVHEFREDTKLLKSAIRQAYEALSEEDLIEAGIIMPQVSQVANKQALLDTLDRDFSSVMSMVSMTQYDRLMDVRVRGAYLKATAKVLDAIISTGAEAREESPINKLYLTWSSLLCHTHPSVCSVSTPFSFEGHWFVISIAGHYQAGTLPESEGGAQDPKSHMFTEPVHVFKASRVESKLQPAISAATTTVMLVAGAAIASIALGVGAFLIGRRHSKHN